MSVRSRCHKVSCCVPAAASSRNHPRPAHSRTSDDVKALTVSLWRTALLLILLYHCYCCFFSRASNSIVTQRSLAVRSQGPHGPPLLYYYSCTVVLADTAAVCVDSLSLPHPGGDNVHVAYCCTALLLYLLTRQRDCRRHVDADGCCARWLVSFVPAQLFVLLEPLLVQTVVPLL